MLDGVGEPGLGLQLRAKAVAGSAHNRNPGSNRLRPDKFNEQDWWAVCILSRAESSRRSRSKFVLANQYPSKVAGWILLPMPHVGFQASEFVDAEITNQ